jgi:hypothetical protein
MTAAMTKRWVLSMGLAAACGGKATTPTSTTTPPPADGMPAAELWAPVMSPGALFTFTDRVHTVEAKVDEVKDAGGDGGKVAMLSWTLNGEPLEMSNLPRAIFVTSAGVRFQSDLTGEPSEDQWPATAAVVDLDKGDYALYIHDGQLGGEKCYGMGPGKDAGECEDVCYVEVCVHPKHGLTGGSGTWWPDFGIFQRRDLTK